jgi:hypothetical protein
MALWDLYLTAKTVSQRPSDLVGIADQWAAYQLDSTVTFFGTVIENAANERENIGSKTKPEWQQRYTMNQLLDPDFRLPAPKKRRDKELDAVAAFAGLPGVRRVKAKSNGGDT